MIWQFTLILIKAYILQDKWQDDKTNCWPKKLVIWICKYIYYVLYFVNMKVVAGPDRNADKNNSSAKAECWYVFVAIREIFTWTRLESASCSGNTADSGAVTGMLSSTVRRAVKKNLYLTVVTITFINMSSLIYWNSGSHLGIWISSSSVFFRLKFKRGSW